MVIDLSAGFPMHQLMFQNVRMSQHLLQPFLLHLNVSSEKELNALEEDLAREWLHPDFCAHWQHCSISGVKG